MVQQVEQRIDGSGTQSRKAFDQFIGNVARIAADHLSQERRSLGNLEVAKNIDQWGLKIQSLVVVLGRRKADQIWNGLRGMIEDRVQKAMIDGEVAPGGRFQKRIGGDAFVTSRIENQIGSQRGATLGLSQRERRFR